MLDSYLASTVKLGTLADFRNGINYSSDNFGSGMKVVGVSDFKNYCMPIYESLAEINPDGVVSDKNLLQNGDVVFVRSNGNRELIGRSLYIDGLKEAVTHSGFTIRLRFHSKDVYPRYYAYLFRTELIRHVLSAYGGGANIANLNQEILSNLDVPLPSLPEQRRIADILSAYDDLIENNTRRIAVLEEMARRIYEEWFVHFRYPSFEQDQKVETELGLVPEGWEIQPFDEIASFVNGYAFKPSDFHVDGLPIIKIKELKAGVQFDTPKYAKLLPEKYRVNNGALLFSWSADLNIYVWTGGEAWLNQHLFLVTPIKNGIPSSFMFHALAYAMPMFRNRSNGATMKHIKRSALSEVVTVVPDAESLGKFDAMVKPIHELVIALNSKNANLRQTRDLLLPRLISGELDVSTLVLPETA